MIPHRMHSRGLASLLVWLLFMLTAASVANAQASNTATIEQRLTPEQMHATGLDTLSPAQLQLLNRLLREGAAAAADASAPASTSATATQQAPVATVDQSSNPAVSSAPASAAIESNANKPAVAPMFIGLDDQPIKSRVQGTVGGWAPDTEFLLENGQRWKVLKGELTLPKPLENPLITVLPGIAGRWFLQVDESLPSARVYRIE